MPNLISRGFAVHLFTSLSLLQNQNRHDLTAVGPHRAVARSAVGALDGGMRLFRRYIVGWYRNGQNPSAACVI